MKKLLFSALVTLLFIPLSSQNISVMQEQSQHYAAYGQHDDPWANGTYFVIFSNGKELKTVRFVKE